MFSGRTKSMVVIACAAATVVAGTVPAYALSIVNVAAGSATSGTAVAVQGASIGAINWKNLNTNFTFTCSSSSLTGAFKAGPNSPANVAQINGGPGQATFNSCAVLGWPLRISGIETTKWMVAATGNTMSGTTPINITGIKFAVSTSSCTFNITGSAAGSYVNGNPSKISIAVVRTAAASNLTVSNVVLVNGASKCFGGGVTDTSPGNKFTLSATWSVTATNGAFNPVTAVAS